jgi:hypothetical protein
MIANANLSRSLRFRFAGLWRYLFTCQTALTAHVSILAARRARALHDVRPLSRQRAQGKPGADCTHGPRAVKKARGRTTGEPEQHRLSLRSGLQLTSRSPRRPGFLATFIGAMREHHRQLDASVGASGPHDFAVRKIRRSSCADLASTASHRNVRDVRTSPLIG